MELHNQTPPVRGIVVVIVIGRPYLWRYPGIFVDRFPSGGYGFSEDMSETRPPLRLGYARVSTVGRTLEAQFDQLKAAGCSGIYRERVSGAKVDREERGKLVKSIAASDKVVGRDRPPGAIDVRTLRDCEAYRGAGGQFQSLAEPWAGTSHWDTPSDTSEPSPTWPAKRAYMPVGSLPSRPERA